MNEKMKKELNAFFEKNIDIKEYLEDINFQSEKPVMKQIYGNLSYHYDCENTEREKYFSLHEKCKLEHEKDDYGKNLISTT